MLLANHPTKEYGTLYSPCHKYVLFLFFELYWENYQLLCFEIFFFGHFFSLTWRHTYASFSQNLSFSFFLLIVTMFSFHFLFTLVYFPLVFYEWIDMFVKTNCHDLHFHPSIYKIDFYYHIRYQLLLKLVSFLYFNFSIK